MRRAVQQQLGLLRGAAAGRASQRLGLAGGLGAARRGAVSRSIQPGWGRIHVSAGTALQARRISTTTPRLQTETIDEDGEAGKDDQGTYSEAKNEHAVISTFDLFSIGIGPSSSHTVGPMRAGNIFVADLVEAGLLQKVHRIRVSIYGSLALTGEGHMTPSALLLGLESANVETVDTSHVPTRFEQIKKEKRLILGHGLPGGKGKEIVFDYERDFKWQWSKKLPLHSNGMRFSVFDEEGMPLATNDLFSVGGGFVVNGALSTAATAASSQAADDGGLPEGGGHPADLVENIFYKEIRRSDATGDRRTGAEIKPSQDVDDPSDLFDSGGGEETKRLSAVVSDSPVSDAVEGGPQQPRYPFRDATSLLALCNKHNLTIAQLVYENERSMGYSDDEIREKVFRIWQVMDNSILEGVQAPSDSYLPGSLKLHRRAPALYKRLTRGLYPTQTFGTGSLRDRLLPPSGGGAKVLSTGLASEFPTPFDGFSAMEIGNRKNLSFGKRPPTRVHGSFFHPIQPSPLRRTTFSEMDYLSVYAMAVNETNAAGGRIVTAPTNGAAGIIPAVLKYTVEFVSDDPERDVLTFLLTAAAIGMLYKRGATISAAEGGCMAEVGVACSMAAGAFAACMGASPETIEQAAEIGIEHNLGLTCDPIAGLVQAPCIERNALGAVKAISSANLALNSDAVKAKVGLDDAIRAMRLTAQGMRNEFKETSLSGLATSVPFNIPVSVPDC